MQRSLLKALEARTLVFDGGMGTQIHACTDCRPSDYLGRDNCTDILVKSRPDIIQRIHENYLAVGADIVETDSFGANILVGREFDEELASWTFDLNKRAAEVARAACAKFERDLARGIGQDRAHIDGDKPRFCGLGDAIGAQHDGRDVGRIAHHRDDDLRPRGDVGRIAAFAGAALEQILDGHPIAVAEHGRGEPLLDEVLRHAVPHHAHADETDPCRLPHAFLTWNYYSIVFHE
jgi:hypothetical protein